MTELMCFGAGSTLILGMLSQDNGDGGDRWEVVGGEPERVKNFSALHGSCQTVFLTKTIQAQRVPLQSFLLFNH